MLSSSKVFKFILGVVPRGGSPNWFKIIVSETLQYIVSFNFVC